MKFMKRPENPQGKFMATSLCIHVSCFLFLERFPLAVSDKLVMCDFLTSLNVCIYSMIDGRRNQFLGDLPKGFDISVAFIMNSSPLWKALSSSNCETIRI